MDREQEEMRFLGLFGIYAESYKIIIAWRKIFSQISLALILPLSFMFLAHMEVYALLFSKIRHDEYQLRGTLDGTQKHDKLSDLISSEMTILWLFRLAYFTCFLIFFLLSTIAVVYTIASIYTTRPMTFKKLSILFRILCRSTLQCNSLGELWFAKYSALYTDWFAYKGTLVREVRAERMRAKQWVSRQKGAELEETWVGFRSGSPSGSSSGVVADDDGFVPKVWKRLMVTFLCCFFTLFLYNVVAALLFILWAFTVRDTDAAARVLIIMVRLYAIGFFYLTIVWQIASVVSVLEDSYGFKAMIKSKNLIKGKMWITIVIFFKLNFAMVAIEILFEKLVVHGGESVSVAGRVGFGILCLFLLLTLFLFGLVIETVIYFVCKSYHHENIDKSTLSDHLEVLFDTRKLPMPSPYWFEGCFQISTLKDLFSAKFMAFW
ncbi:hypothetical protein TEA_006404 [Camellia sinensis var. sinensis]|uniref:Uncharacterized protein n=1 Tax=Camellia sinensis var. sinensis TaxID=542762 RepID=A0A4S4DWR3_CAMSN|nr:hypothetical protein TEA_006404 [Camellia sinensis var. sinensis]